MKNEEDYTKFIVVIGVVFLLFLGVLMSFYTIKAGQRGVLLTFGKADINAKPEGLGFKIPIIQSIVKMEVQTQKYEADASAASKDLQIVSTKIAVNYHLLPETTPKIYTDVGLGYQDRLIQPAVQEVVKGSTAQFTAEELITRRPEVKDKIRESLRERLSERGIIVEDISITNFDFSNSFNAAIENKVTQEQNALAAKNKLEQIKFEAQQKVEEARGKAESMKIESEALKQNPDILELRSIEKWNGIMPTTLITGGSNIFPTLPITS